MEGVMMRNGNIYGLAVRLPGGHIFRKQMEWRALGSSAWQNWPFLRGFPILLESVINGIQAFNLSVNITGQRVSEKPWQPGLAIIAATVLAILLFVGVPHFLAFLMQLYGLGGDVGDISFHLWDGFYKCAIFIGYIWLIAFIPDIRRIFEYHGAEHKIINAWESGLAHEAGRTACMSRLHPRCGTTFLLFVICIAIIMQALLIPFFLHFWSGLGILARHLLGLILKLLLVLPISACGYELIRFSARTKHETLGKLLQAPGLALQMLTTREPNQAQLEVAEAALATALGEDQKLDYSL